MIVDNLFRFSTVAEISQDPAPESDLMSFIEGTFDQIKGIQLNPS